MSEEFHEEIGQSAPTVVPQKPPTELANVAEMYGGTANMGTEEMSQEDINTPTLRIVQPNTQNIDDKHEGWFYRSDVKQQLQNVEVNLVYVTTAEVDNYDKTGKEKVKVYFGYYADTQEPFKMFVRGWSLSGHRKFQTELAVIKSKLKVPMFALRVQLVTEKHNGTLKNGKPYTSYKLEFNILKNQSGTPLIQMDANRIGFLFDSVTYFKTVAQSSEVATEETVDEVTQAVEAVEKVESVGDQPASESTTAQDEAVAEDIPF